MKSGDLQFGAASIYKRLEWDATKPYNSIRSMRYINADKVGQMWRERNIDTMVLHIKQLNKQIYFVEAKIFCEAHFN